MSFIEGPPGFEPLNWSKPVVKSRRKLPHWVQEGATYFITFRLADSLPQEKLDELERLQAQWEAAHPPPRDPEAWQQFHRETMQRIDDWLDVGAGECCLRDPRCAGIVSHALHHFHGQRYFLPAYCVMPNHVHVLVKPAAGHEPADLLHSWKSFTAKAINKHLQRTGEVWEPESHDTLVRDARHLWNALRYIGKNPGKANIPEDQWIRFVDPSWERAGFGFETKHDPRHGG